MSLRSSPVLTVQSRAARRATSLESTGLCAKEQVDRLLPAGDGPQMTFTVSLLEIIRLGQDDRPTCSKKGRNDEEANQRFPRECRMLRRIIEIQGC